ncbi:unnamed protein product [Echinostoma caproni]|uniref:Uncharacterized protein n=1 Tax=Echinostoma caproni TaxID=27848 RepID=A0A183A1L5_9TREM|nr:unnamed protein product [Echinostoma caproni]
MTTSDTSDSTDQSELVKDSIEWTLWKRGMRLSIANGQIGLARLQQFTRGPCALHRPPWTSRCLDETSRLPRFRDGLQMVFESDEWEELTATEGEELNPDCEAHDSETGITGFRQSVPRNSNTAHTYRSGVVGAARSTYQDREVRLLRWINRPPSCPTVDHTAQLNPESSQPNLQPVNITESHPASMFAFHQPGELIHEDYSKSYSL